MGKLMVIVGGQYGSEGKGAVVSHLARTEPGMVLGVRVGGSNAGHTAYDPDGNRWPLRHIPVPMLYGNPGLIAAGSEIDLPVLRDELSRLTEAGLTDADHLLIDSQATVVEEWQIEEEHGQGLTQRIGSTGKGVGAARAARIQRRALLPGDVPWKVGEPDFTDGAESIRTALAEGYTVIIEGTQGYGLGLHAGFYPFCTSADCRAIDFLSQAGVCPWWPEVTKFEVWVVLRTYPIRVAGNSGPLKHETTWENLRQQSGGYIQAEQTTVTQKTRRVGDWDQGLATRALEANGVGAYQIVNYAGVLRREPVVQVALTMFDYWHPDERNETVLRPKHEAQIVGMESTLNAQIGLVGTGPDTMVDRR